MYNPGPGHWSQFWPRTSQNHTVLFFVNFVCIIINTSRTLTKNFRGVFCFFWELWPLGVYKVSQRIAEVWKIYEEIGRSRWHWHDPKITPNLPKFQNNPFYLVWKRQSYKNWQKWKYECSQFLKLSFFRPRFYISGICGPISMFDHAKWVIFEY